MMALADIVQMKSILETVASAVKKEFKCKVYYDEVLKNFTKPCFFIAITTVSTPQTINYLERKVSIFLTYFPPDTMRNELHYLDVFDRMQNLFNGSIDAGGRNLKIDTLTAERIGEDRDILQVEMDITYLERTNKEVSTAELMDTVEVDITTEPDEEYWQG